MRCFEEGTIVKPHLMASKLQLILACHITGVYDVNRNTTLQDDAYELVQEWAESVAKANLKGIIFHNNFSDETCARFENTHISFERIEYNPEFNPNVYRYFIYRDFLAKSLDPIQGVLSRIFRMLPWPKIHLMILCIKIIQRLFFAGMNLHY